jgi:hypothetical protein
MHIGMKTLYNNIRYYAGEVYNLLVLVLLSGKVHKLIIESLFPQKP